MLTFKVQYFPKCGWIFKIHINLAANPVVQLVLYTLALKVFMKFWTKDANKSRLAFTFLED